MGKSLYQQMSRAISEHTAAGHSKYRERAGGVDTTLRVYSKTQYKDLKQTARQFGDWMKQEHPEVKWASQITSDHVSEFLNDSTAHDWNAATTAKEMSYLQKIGGLCGDTYSGNKWGWTDGLQRPQSSEKERCEAMTGLERDCIRESAENGRGEALKAASFGSYFGLRVQSIPRITVNDVQNDGLHIIGDKGGRDRVIPYSSADQREAAQKAVQWAADHDRTGSDPVFSVGSNAIGRSVQRCLKSNGYSVGSSSMHALRKTWARERYEAEYAAGHGGLSPYIDTKTHEERHALDDRDLSEGVKYDRTAWDVVAAELGHGSGRTDLFNAYIKATQGR